MVSPPTREAKPRRAVARLRRRGRPGVFPQRPGVLHAAGRPLGRQTLDRHLHRRQLGRTRRLELQIPLPQLGVVQREFSAPEAGVCGDAWVWVVEQLLRALEPQPRPTSTPQLPVQCLGQFWLFGQLSAELEQLAGGVPLQHVPVELAVDGQRSTHPVLHEHQRASQPKLADRQRATHPAFSVPQHAANKPCQIDGCPSRAVVLSRRRGGHVQQPNGEHDPGSRQRVWRPRLVFVENPQWIEAQG